MTTHTIKPNTLSVVIVTLNEEANIARCLTSVTWANEIIIIDSGSQDETLEIARSFKANVYQRDWPGDGPQKKFGVEKASCEWVLVLDADEELSTELAHSIKSVINSGTNFYYKLHRRSFFLGKIINHGDWGRDWIVRLFQPARYQWSDDIAHSKLEVKKSSAKSLEGKLFHHTQDNIHTSIQKLNDYSTLSAQMIANRGGKASLLKAIIRGQLAFIRSYVLRLGFLDGVRGYLLARNIAQGAYLKYLKLCFEQ